MIPQKYGIPGTTQQTQKLSKTGKYLKGAAVYYLAVSESQCTFRNIPKLEKKPGRDSNSIVLSIGT